MTKAKFCGESTKSYGGVCSLSGEIVAVLQNRIEAWKIGKIAGLEARGVEACLYPSGTTASAEYWLGHAEGHDEWNALQKKCVNKKKIVAT